MTASDLTTTHRRDRFRIGASLRVADLEEDVVGVSRLLRENEPVSWCEADQVRLVAAYDLLDDVHRDQSRFITDLPSSEMRQVFGETMLTSDGPAHRTHRRPFGRTLRHQYVDENYADQIRSQAEQLLVDADGRHLDLRNRFAPRVRSTLERAARSAPQSVLGTVAREYGGDAGDPLIVNNVINLIFGGADPVASLVALSIWALLMHPRQLDEVMQDWSLLPRAIDEVSRCQSPFGMSARYVARDCTLGGVELLAGEKPSR